MKKRIYGIVLALCTLLCIAHTAAAADVGGRSHTVTVRAAEHGKISVDGKNFSESISITVKDGQTLREVLGSAAIEIQPDYAYAFDHFNTRDMIVSAVAVGTVNDSRHNVVVDRYGKVWLGGLNTYGQLGTEKRLGVKDDDEWYYYSNRLDMLTEGVGNTLFADAAVGTGHTLLLDRDGNIWSAGNNKSGQLGRPNAHGSIEIIEGSLYYDANPRFEKVTAGVGNTKFVKVFAKGYNSAAIDENGRLWIAGYLGSDTFVQVEEIKDEKFVTVAVCNDAMIAVAENGKVFVKGENDFKKLGFPLPEGKKRTDIEHFTEPEELPKDVKFVDAVVSTWHSALLDENGGVWTAGDNYNGKLGRPEGFKDFAMSDTGLSFARVTEGIGNVRITDIATSENTLFFLDEDGKIWCTGYLVSDCIPTCTFPEVGKPKTVSLVPHWDTPVCIDENGRFRMAADRTNDLDLVVDFTAESLLDYRISCDTVFTACFSEREKVHIYFDLAGGEWTEGFTPPDFYCKGDEYIPPKAGDVKRDGYRLVGWEISRKYGGSWGDNYIGDVYTAKWRDISNEPQLRINPETNEWEVRYYGDEEWTPLGVKATGERGEPGKDGEKGETGVTPILGIDENGIWYVSYDGGATRKSLGVAARGENGDKGDKGDAGADGKDGADGVDGNTPFIGENGNWWIGDTDTGVRAAGARGDKGDKGDTGADGKDGRDGTDGKDGTTPQLKIGTDNLWYVSYDGGKTWTSLGVKATGEKGEKGDKGDTGADGLNPFIGENGNWWIGEKDTGVKVSADTAVPAGYGAVAETSPLAVTAVSVAGVSLLSNLALILYIVMKKKKSLV